MYLFPVWKELSTYLMGEIGLVHASMNYKSPDRTTLKYYNILNQVDKKTIDFTDFK